MVKRQATKKTTKRTSAITLAAGAVAVTGLALAPWAAADPAPPVAPGAYNMLAGGSSYAEQVTWNCGPSCFTMGSPGSSSRRNYRFDPATGQWRDGDAWTSDGIHYFGGPAPGLLAPA